MAREGRTRSRDGVEIAFTVCGSGSPALVFVHGGLASRAFWHRQVPALGAGHRLAALDLAGHGNSGRGRARWSIAGFAADVCAVVDALALESLVLVGNSLGGPVALEAAAALRGRCLGVVGVDTFHDLARREDPAIARARAAAFRADPEGSCRAMAAQLFHPGADPALRAWVEREFRVAPVEVVVPLLESLGDYELAAAVARAAVPIRALNGDLWPVRLEENRRLAPGFALRVLPGTGHFPMLERPAEFARALLELVAELVRTAESDPSRHGA